MSADNRICIMHVGGPTSWAVWHGSMSARYDQPPSDSKWFDTHTEAYIEARNQAADCAVLEGGIQCITKDEQAEALTEIIGEANHRLASLLAFGTQKKDEEDTK